ncbi:MAG: hypothetical protein FWD33_04280 [Alphaproteobacteria bacterium]|nr:hypothetical protein [Alphaproteobacteria bacterium]
MPIIKMPFIKSERGAGMLDAILAIGIIGITAPFLYAKISESAREIQEVSYAKRLSRLGNAVSNFIAMNETVWPDNFEYAISSEDFFEYLAPFGAVETRNLPPPSLQIFKTTSQSGVRTTQAYMISDKGDSTILWGRKFAQMLGPEGGVSEEDDLVYSVSGQWSARLPGTPPGKIVLRITNHSSDNDQTRFLHRVRVTDAPELNMMETNLVMSDGGRRHSIINAKRLEGVGLDATDMTASGITANAFASNSVLFQDGLRLNPQMSEMNSLRVGGDIMGARLIRTRALFGGLAGGGFRAATETAFSNQGRIISDRTSVHGELDVGNNLVIKPGSARTISAWGEISAFSVSAPYLSVEYLMFGGASGITVSNDKLGDRQNPPIKLGGWSFPNQHGDLPSFSSLKLLSLSSDPVGEILSIPRNPMAKITSKGWMNPPQQQEVE